jgi:hypothetical protein
MPWRKSEPMEQRIEFVLKAMQPLNFRALCQQYWVSTKTGYKWKSTFKRVLERTGLTQKRRRRRSIDYCLLPPDAFDFFWSLRISDYVRVKANYLNAVQPLHTLCGDFNHKLFLATYDLTAIHVRGPFSKKPRFR